MSQFPPQKEGNISLFLCVEWLTWHVGWCYVSWPRGKQYDHDFTFFIIQIWKLIWNKNGDLRFQSLCNRDRVPWKKRMQQRTGDIGRFILFIQFICCEGLCRLLSIKDHFKEQYMSFITEEIRVLWCSNWIFESMNFCFHFFQEQVKSFWLVLLMR